MVILQGWKFGNFLAALARKTISILQAQSCLYNIHALEFWLMTSIESTTDIPYTWIKWDRKHLQFPQAVEKISPKSWRTIPHPVYLFSMIYYDITIRQVSTPLSGCCQSLCRLWKFHTNPRFQTTNLGCEYGIDSENSILCWCHISSLCMDNMNSTMSSTSLRTGSTVWMMYVPVI